MRPHTNRFRWRDYRTASGARPVKVFLDTLSDEEAASVVAAMKDVAERGLDRARHLRGDVYEVRADSDRRAFRILFSQETKFILLSLSVFSKKSQTTPPRELALADARLRDWRERGGRPP
jgi:phage-related protein